jgi:hypothetical protein
MGIIQSLLKQANNRYQAGTVETPTPFPFDEFQFSFRPIKTPSLCIKGIRPILFFSFRQIKQRLSWPKNQGTFQMSSPPLGTLAAIFFSSNSLVNSWSSS